MKIIFVHFNNGFSGSPKVLQTVIEALPDYNKILITNKTEGFLSKLNVKYEKFSFNLSKHKILTLIFYVKAQFTTFFKVLFIARKGNLVYINTTIPIFAAIAAKIKGTKVLFHLHEDRKSLNVVHRFVSSFRRYFCDVEIFVSKYLFIQEHIEGKEYYIVNNVLSPDFFNQATLVRNYEKNNEEFIILMICSLKEYKGVFEFISLAKKMVKYEKIFFKLVLSESYEVINIYFKKIEIPKNVIIIDSTSDTSYLYENASVLVNMSRPDQWVETFGMTILEGMAYGLPCIVPMVGGPSELIVDGINGYHVSCYDINKFEEIIVNLYFNKLLYLNIAEENLEKSKNNNFENFKNQINEIVYKCLKQ